ncbi:hypothetical protein XENOCAPTIV_015445 [Xenoophorus captivus]|uniref:Secreted protein n=1 Tax=Xenoophorus captivus TaxID=1517983 RepID=A0ABV0RL43_9TELE
MRFTAWSVSVCVIFMLFASICFSHSCCPLISASRLSFYFIAASCPCCWWPLWCGKSNRAAGRHDDEKGVVNVCVAVSGSTQAMPAQVPFSCHHTHREVLSSPSPLEVSQHPSCTHSTLSPSQMCCGPAEPCAA